MSEEREADPGAASRPEARVTPYELVFTDRFETSVFPRILEDAKRVGTDPLFPDRFQLLSTVGEAVREVVPEDAPPEALEQYRALLYHAFNFWRFEKPVYVLDAAVARYLVEAAPGPDGWELSLPHPAIYLQLPANLFWGSVSPEMTPEPVDGFFLTSAQVVDPLGGEPLQRLFVLVVLGIRRHRAGFSVIPFDTETGAGIAGEWAAAESREGGRDFQSTLPGGEMAGLYSILTTSEVLKLLGRALWYVDLFPGAVTLEPVPEPHTLPPGTLPPPGLPFHRVALTSGEAGEP